MKAEHQPTVAFIGAGRMGGALAIALNRRGYEVRAMVARSRENAQRIAELFDSERETLALSASELDKLPETQILIIAAPDDSIADIAKQLAAQSTLQNKVNNISPIALHLSGALSSEILSPLRAQNFAVGSMHPLVSVSDAAAGALQFRGAYFCVEGDAEAVETARKIVADLGGNVFTIETQNKTLYHAAAVLTAGHTVALFDAAVELLKICGLSADEAQKTLVPLLASVVKNLSAQTPEQSLTGTFARGDAATVEKHLAALTRSEQTREALEIYKLLGLRALEMARRRGVDVRKIRAIEELMREQ
jgi:predicted short-subunit dehydrogenase-like oxidoreductase (DUF2520 family)